MIGPREDDVVVAHAVDRVVPYMIGQQPPGVPITGRHVLDVFDAVGHVNVSCKSWESVCSLFQSIPWYMANNHDTKGVGQKGKSKRNAFTNR